MKSSLRFTISLAALVLLVLAAPAARADTCYDPKNRNFDCNAQPGAPPQAAPSASPPPHDGLREELRRRLGEFGATGDTKRTDDIKERWVDARQRAEDATYRAQQTDDPGQKAQLKQQYETAMRDLRRAGNDLIKVDPKEASAIRSALKEYETAGAREAAAAGFTAPPPVATAAPPTAPGPPNVIEEHGNVYVCDGAIKGNNLSCREIGPSGAQCTAVTAMDGVVGWRDSTSTPCRDEDLAQRDAYLAQNAAARSDVAKTRDSAFTVDPGETARSVTQLTGEQLKGALDSLPPQCRADFEKFIATGTGDKSKANGAQAVASYSRLDKDPACRDGVKRIADALGVGLPRRKVAADQRDDWTAALAGSRRASVEAIPEVDVSNISDTGFDTEDALGSAADFLAGLSGNLKAMSGSMRTMPGYRPAAADRPHAPSSAGVQYHPAPAVNGCTGTYVCSAQ